MLEHPHYEVLWRRTRNNSKISKICPEKIDTVLEYHNPPCLLIICHWRRRQTLKSAIFATLRHLWSRPCPWPWTGSYGTLSFSTHGPQHKNQILFKSENFVDGQTYIWIDGQYIGNGIIRSTPVDLIIITILILIPTVVRYTHTLRLVLWTFTCLCVPGSCDNYWASTIWKPTLTTF